jgi:hypothetical protein
MAAVMPVEAWYVLSVLLAPVGYVVQDVVADAMTVEAVPRVDEDGSPSRARPALMHTTMQTLGRVAIIGGGVFVAAERLLFAGVDGMDRGGEGRHLHPDLRAGAADPGDLGARACARRPAEVARPPTAAALRHRPRRGRAAVRRRAEQTEPNWWILGGSLVFVVFTLTMGLGDLPYNQEIIFVGSMAIILFLISRLMRELEPEARACAARHRDHHLRLPRHAEPRAGPDLVDDRPARLRSAVPVGAVADRQHPDAARHVHLPPLHGGALHRLRRRLPDHRQHPALHAHRRHVLRPARVDRGASPAASSMPASSPWSTPRWSRRWARSR